MVQIACPSVEKHAVTIMAEFNRMRRENDHCDFIIQVDNDVYHTHKNVLSAGSDYFKAMLNQNTKESRDGIVVFKDVDSQCVKSCIDFIYSGESEIAEGKLDNLLHVAILMQLEDVKQTVSNILSESITVQKYFSIEKVADMYGLNALHTKCRSFFHENIMQISDLPKFGNVGKNDILDVTRSDQSSLCEEKKMMLLLTWVEKNQGNMHDFRDCLKLLKFNEMSLAFLKNQLETHPVIINDFGLCKLINDHLMKATEKLMEAKYGGELIILFDTDTDCIRSFNPMTRKIEKFHEEKFNNLMHFGMISLDSYIYVLCRNKFVHRLDCRSKDLKWEKMRDMICDHGWGPRSVSLSGSIFVIGGRDPKPTDVVERFDPSTNQWFLLEKKPKAISDTSLLSLNDSIYCIGGKGQDGHEVCSFCKFTPSSSEWVDLDPMRYCVRMSGVVAVDQKIFVIGGWVGGEKINDVECYDTTLAQWTSLSSMNAFHVWNNAHVVGNWIFAVGNCDPPDDMEKYDILNNVWYQVQPKVDQSFRIYASTVIKL